MPNRILAISAAGAWLAVMDDLVLHRLQFAFTVTYHYLFPQLTMGLNPSTSGSPRCAPAALLSAVPGEQAASIETSSDASP